MNDALITTIIDINKPWLEIRREFSDGESVVLRRDVAALCPLQDAGLILAAMSEFKLVGIPTGR